MKSARATVYSAKPPLTEKQVKVGELPRFSAPRTQYAQVPSVPPSHETPTRMPRLRPGVRSPATISPTIWWPGVMRSCRGASSPSTMCRSVRHTPQARTFNRTWPEAGSGRGKSDTRSGRCWIGPGAASTALRMSQDAVRAIRFREGLQFVRIQLEIGRGERIFQVRHFGRSDDRCCHAGLLHQPSQSHLRVGHTALLGDRRDPIHHLEILRLVIVLRRKLVGLRANGFSLVLFSTLPCDESARERAE